MTAVDAPLTRATQPTITMEDDGHNIILKCSGRMVIVWVEALQRALPSVTSEKPTLFDLSQVDALDTAGAWLIADFERRTRAVGGSVEIRGASALQSGLLDTVRQNLHDKVVQPDPPHGFVPWLDWLGQTTVSTARTGLEVIGFFGIFVSRIALLFRYPRRLRFTAMVSHMHQIGWDAIPIVSLMAFLIGVVLAFQGATQLRQFGAEVFVVDLIAISVLRELGILLTAIIVAGRSGAAFTAAIGSMKINEEIDAMTTLGLDPFEVLILPRVLALTFVLPILGFIADIMGLLGGATMSWIELGVSPGMFLTRLGENIGVWHYGVGLIKAPFFAVFIGVIGCYQGMKVKGNADSLGQLTSKSVVQSIFMVIVVDALFSVFFSIVGV